MIDLLTKTGPRAGDIADLLAAVDDGSLTDLPAMAPEWRPGVVTSLAVVRRVLRLYGDAVGSWDAVTYRAAWDTQLGPETRRLIAPLSEVALFQPPMTDPSKARPQAIEHMVSFAGQQHVRKLSYGADAQTALLGILGGTWRPHANFNTASSRAGTLVLLPGNGTLGSEVRVLSDAMPAERTDGAGAHFPWLSPRPARPPAAESLPTPWLDIERTIRLTDEGAVAEPCNARWVARGAVIDPSMAVNLSGPSAGKPWRPSAKSDASLLLHKALAGSPELSRPLLMSAVEQQPQVRICVLHTREGGTGGTEGYREWEIAIPRRTASVFARSPDVVAETSRRLLDAVEAMRSALGSAMAEAGIAAEVRQGYLRTTTETARHASVRLLLDLADQESVHRALHAHAWRGFDTAVATCNPLHRARGERRLLDALRSKLPLPAETTMTATTPATVRQAHAAIKAMDERLSAAERAKLRTAVPGQLSLTVTALVLTSARRAEALEGAEGEAWETAALALGSMRALGPNTGRALAETGYPELRAQQMLAATGDGLRSQVRSALRWLTAHGVTAVRIGDVLALMLADARGDAAALKHARREIAVGYVRGVKRDDEQAA